MTIPLTIEETIHFNRRGHRKEIQRGPETVTPLLVGRVPRVARFMALAIHLDRLVRSGSIANYAELARLGHVTRARVTQIMNLLHLAPGIQEEILFLPLTERGRDHIILRDLLPIAAQPIWQIQQTLWRQLIKKTSQKRISRV